MVNKLYPVVWTPDFLEDVSLAVEYVANVLKAPIAAKNMLDGITAQLENVRAIPTAAVVRYGQRGEKYYILSYKNYNIYYIIENETIKAVGLKHQLQNL
jgi:plasmid stabilization system protein ParE